MVICEDYEISQTTIALLHNHHEKYQTKILDLEGEFYSSKPIMKLLEEACLNNCSTYEGRRQAVIHFTNYTQRIPILINQFEKIIAFPTHSPEQSHCIWIFFHQILEISPINKTQSLITFKNYKQLQLNISFHTLHEQCKKAAICITRFCYPSQFSFWLKPRQKKIRRYKINNL
jgi:competence protein ComK